jgi:hypothetical protein
MGVGDKLKDIGSYVRKLRRSTDPDSYYQYRRAVSARVRRQSTFARTQSAMVSRSVRRQSGSVTTKSATGLSA